MSDVVKLRHIKINFALNIICLKAKTFIVAEICIIKFLISVVNRMCDICMRCCCCRIYGSYTMKVISAAAFGLDIDTKKEPNHPFIQNAIDAISSFLGNPITVFASKRTQ